jgi:hypothetical protein
LRDFRRNRLYLCRLAGGVRPCRPLSTCVVHLGRHCSPLQTSLVHHESCTRREEQPSSTRQNAQQPAWHSSAVGAGARCKYCAGGTSSQ